MNIEIFEAKDNKKTDAEKLSPKEKKEKMQQQTQSARDVCQRYHDELDSTTYMDQRAMNKANELLPLFSNLKTELLPDSVKYVIQHRLAYLKLMVDLSKNKKIKKLMFQFAPSISDMGLLEGNYEELKAEVSKSGIFKSLNLDDYNEALTALTKARKTLQGVTSKKGSWDVRARKHLMPAGFRGKKARRVDDLKASRNLEKAVEQLIQNISRLRRERTVLGEDKNKKKTS